MRFALLSHILPPSPSGQAVVLHRILSEVSPDSYYLISREFYPQTTHDIDDPLRLEAPYYTLSPEPQVYHPYRYGLWRIRNLINIFLSILWRTVNILKIVRNNPIEILIACTGDIANIPAGFLASRIKGFAFIAYIFDDYVYQWTGGYRQVAEMISPFIFKRSRGIIGPNEFICDEYEQRYRVKSTLVRNPCARDELTKIVYTRWPAEYGKIKVIYTGAVYHANFDCFRNLIRAMDTLIEYNLELHIFTAQTPEELSIQQVEGEHVFIHSHVPYSQILEQQRKADILFLPLAFESPIPEVIRTSAPGKLGEYLASGRPILAHVPADSFVAYYLGRYGCGWIAGQNDPSKLAMEIKRLVANPEARIEIIQNAHRQASLDFSPEIARNLFMEYLKDTSSLEIKQ
jgi:glycosyltransferase involved in cell wall biosynthesis